MLHRPFQALIALVAAALIAPAVALAFAPLPYSGLQTRTRNALPDISCAVVGAPASLSAGPVRPLGNRTRFPSGIGGLLAITEVAGVSTNVFLPVCDQVGTIHALVAAMTNSVPVAAPFVAVRYEYSP
jgi:hypothetical protein